MGDAITRRATWAWIVVYLAISAWALHWLWGPELTPGMDTAGHLVRLDAAFEMFRSGRLDGWMDRTMLGYQLHLVYGVGFAALVGIVKVLGFGVLSTAGAYKLTGVLATVAIPFAGMAMCRSLGFKANTAWPSGLLMLGVSSYRSSGIEGAFHTGLVPQQVGAAMVLAAWAAMLAKKPRPLILGLLVGALAFTHPYSLLMFIIFAPFLLAMSYLRNRKVHWRPLIFSAVVAVTSSAWWWIPIIPARHLRGPMTYWVTPNFWEQLRLVVDGKLGVAAPLSILLVAALLFLVYQNLYERNLRQTFFVITPITAYSTVRLFISLSGSQHTESAQIADRALPFMLYLLIPNVGLFLCKFKKAGISLGIAAVAVAALTLTAPERSLYQPWYSLNALAHDLGEEVPDGYRYAFAEAPRVGFGVPEPSRYLGWKAGVGDLSIFGPEWAPGSDVSFQIYTALSHENVQGWLASMKNARVSHLVSGNENSKTLFANRGDLQQVATHGNLAIWELIGPRQVAIANSSPNRLALTVTANADNETVAMPIGYSPGWQVDGYSLGRSENGRLTVVVPQGTSHIVLHWQLPRVHTYAWLLTFVGMCALLIFFMRPSQIIERQRWNDAFPSP